MNTEDSWARTPEFKREKHFTDPVACPPLAIAPGQPNHTMPMQAPHPALPHPQPPDTEALQRRPFPAEAPLQEAAVVRAAVVVWEQLGLQDLLDQMDTMDKMVNQDKQDSLEAMPLQAQPKHQNRASTARLDHQDLQEALDQRDPLERPDSQAQPLKLMDMSLPQAHPDLLDLQGKQETMDPQDSLDSQVNSPKDQVRQVHPDRQGLQDNRDNQASQEAPEPLPQDQMDPLEMPDPMDLQDSLDSQAGQVNQVPQELAEAATIALHQEPLQDIKEISVKAIIIIFTISSKINLYSQKLLYR